MAGWYGGTTSGWERRRQFTIDHTKVTGTPTGVPICIVFSGLTSASADDIRVTGADGTTEWPVEVISCVSGAGVLWTRAPSLSSSVDTEGFLYYDNPLASAYAVADPYGRNAVWAGAKMILHMEEAAAGTGTADLYVDSSGNNNHGDDYVSATGKTGVVASGQEFDGSNDYISLDSSPFQSQTEGTVLAWVTPDVVNQAAIFNHGAATGTSNFWSLELNTLNLGTFGFRLTCRTGAVDRYNVRGTTVMSTGNTYHVAASVDGSGVRAQIDGNAETLAVYAGSSSNPHFWDDMGANGNFTRIGVLRYAGSDIRHFDGPMDEVWIWGTALSTDFISTVYQNQFSPGTFLSLGSEELVCTIAITSIVPSACSGGSHDVDVTVSYTYPPASGTLDIDIDGNTQSFAITSSPQTVTYNLGLSCLGGTNTVTASFSDGGCNDQDTYTAPTACTMNITAISPSACIGGVGCTYFVDVTFAYTGSPGGNVIIDIDGDTYTRAITSSPQTERITARTCGVGAGNVEVYFQSEPGCADTDTFVVPSPLTCSIGLGSISPGACSGGNYSVDLQVLYSNEPCSGQIEVILNGVDSYLYVIDNSGDQTLTIPGRPCNEGTVTVEVEFTANPGCSDSASYLAPTQPCSLTILGAIPGACSSLQYDLQVALLYSGAPASGTIQVQAGASAPQNFAITSSPQVVTLVGLPCDTGTTSLYAFFTSEVGCNDSTTFLAPASDPPASTIRVSIDGTDYSSEVDLGEFTIDMVSQEAEIFFEYPGRVSFVGGAYQYLRSQYLSNPCTRPAVVISTKCLGDDSFEQLVSLEIRLDSSEWDLVSCRVSVAMEDVSASQRLRGQRGKKVCIDTDRTVSGLYEAENNCDYGYAVPGILLFDLIKEVADATLGAGTVVISSTILSQSYQPEKWQIDFPTLAGAAAPYIYADAAGLGAHDDMRAIGYTGGAESNTTSLRRLWRAFHFLANRYPKQYELTLPWIDYDPETNDSRFVLSSHVPLTLSVGPTGTTKTKTQSWQPGFGNLVVCPDLGGDRVCTSWGEVVDLLRRIGLGVFYNGETISIEYFADFFQAGGTANTPVDLGGDFAGKETVEREWLMEKILLGEDSPLTFRDEDNGNQAWVPCDTADSIGILWVYDRTLGSTVVSSQPVDVVKPGEYTANGDIVIDASATSITVTFDVEIFVNGESVYTISTGESIPAGTGTYSISPLTPFSLDLNNGYQVEIRLTNVNDVAEASLFVDGGSTFGVVVSANCPSGPVIFESNYDNTQNPFGSATNTCQGEIKDFRTGNDWHFGFGRLVSNSIGQGDHLGANYCFFIDTGTNEIIRYRRPFYFSTNTTHGNPPCSATNLDNQWNGWSFYNAHLSRWALYYHVAYGHRLNLAVTLLRNTTQVITTGGGRFTTSTSSRPYYSFAFASFAALGPAPHRRLQFEAFVSEDMFAAIVSSKRLEATVCGTVETGEVGRVSWSLIQKKARIELLAN